jgi:hypothetical protein
MYLTMVFLCFIGHNDCIRFEDTTGLKQTRQQCVTRAIEMVQQLQTIPHIVPPPYTVSYKCVLREST